MNDHIERGALHRAQIDLGRVHGHGELPKRMPAGICQAQVDRKLRADAQGAGISENHALRLAVAEHSAALERQQGRAYGVRVSPDDRSTVRILEI